MNLGSGFSHPPRFVSLFGNFTFSPRSRRPLTRSPRHSLAAAPLLWLLPFLPHPLGTISPFPTIRQFFWSLCGRRGAGSCPFLLTAKAALLCARPPAPIRMREVIDYTSLPPDKERRRAAFSSFFVPLPILKPASALTSSLTYPFHAYSILSEVFSFSWPLLRTCPWRAVSGSRFPTL